MKVNHASHVAVAVSFAVSFCWSCSRSGEPAAGRVATPSAALSSTAASAGIALTPAADTTVREADPLKNLSRERDLVVSSAEDDARVLLRFELGTLPANTVVSGASLSLFPDPQAVGGKIELHPMLQPWTLKGATWRCANQGMTAGGEDSDRDANDPVRGTCAAQDRWSIEGASPPFVRTPSATSDLRKGQRDAVVFDVSADVAVFAGGAANAGWILSAGTKGVEARFDSSRDQHPPRLDLLLACAPGATGDPGAGCVRDLCAGKTCSAPGQCQSAACDPQTGDCIASDLPAGTKCNDGDLCTTGDVCNGAVCSGTLVACVASDQCHSAGACDPSTGACSDTPLDGTPCTLGGVAAVCSAGTCVIPLQPPATVSGTANPDGSITVTFSASANATGYLLSSSGSAGGPFTQVASGAASPLTDPSPAPGATTYYRVAAVDGPATATGDAIAVLAVPAAPANLAAQFGTGQVTLTWAPSFGATSYRVSRGTVPGGALALWASAVSSPFVDTGLTNGITYYYEVSALDAAGAGAFAGPVSATPHFTCTGSYVAGDDPTRLLGLQVTPGASNVLAAASGSVQLNAWGFYRAAPSTPVDLTAQVTWTSSDQSVAQILAGAVTYSNNPGTVTLTATLGSSTGAASLRVWDPAKFASITSLLGSAPGAWNMGSGACTPVSMTANYLDGTSEDVTAMAVWSDSCFGRVIGQDLFVATGPCSDGYGSFTGSLGLGALSTTVSTAIWGPVLSATCNDARSPGPLWGITVTGQASLYVGEAVQFSAQGYFSDGTSRDISYQVNYGTCNPDLLQMDPDGLATGGGAGQGFVGAAVLQGVSGVAQVQVSLPPPLGSLTALSQSPDNLNASVGNVYLLRAIGSYAGVPGHLINVTNQASWTTSDAGVAPIAGGVGNGVAIGTAQVSAALGGLSVTGNVRVWDSARLAAITGFQVSGNGNMSHGTGQQWHLLAYFNNSATDYEDVSATSLWWPHQSCWGELSTTGYFTADGGCYGGYDIIQAWMGRGLGAPLPIEFGVW